MTTLPVRGGRPASTADTHNAPHHIHLPIASAPPYFQQRSHNPRGIVQILKRSFEQGPQSQIQQTAIRLLPQKLAEINHTLDTRADQIPEVRVFEVVRLFAVCFDWIFYQKALTNRLRFKRLPNDFPSRGRSGPRRDDAAWHCVLIKLRFWDERNRRYYRLKELIDILFHELVHAPYILFTCAACYHDPNYELLGKGHGVLYQDLATAIQRYIGAHGQDFLNVPFDLGIVRSLNRELHESFPDNAAKRATEAQRWGFTPPEMDVAQRRREELMERRRYRQTMERAETWRRRIAREQLGTVAPRRRHGRHARWWQRLSGRDRRIFQRLDSRRDAR